VYSPIYGVVHKTIHSPVLARPQEKDAMSASTTVRVTAETHERLRTMADQRGTSMQDLIDKLAEDQWKNDLLDAMAEAFAVLADDPVASKERDAELTGWEQTLIDGIED
jgi:predicted DNA-binding ribbon-helix-helix protein